MQKMEVTSGGYPYQSVAKSSGNGVIDRWWVDKIRGVGIALSQSIKDFILMFIFPQIYALDALPLSWSVI